MHAVPVQLDHIKMIAAVLVALLVLKDNEERLRRYGVGSAHGCAKIAGILLGASNVFEDQIS